ncbi:hypothetical protein [Actinopolyspora halophila]|uniref:hypothetical protein n=1 Tax=Actinopolyspora halophila TaxID=1850 RepID=UPI0003AA1242|nr:hypothetical protein [Actinopolyspora halophila]
MDSLKAHTLDMPTGPRMRGRQSAEDVVHDNTRRAQFAYRGVQAYAQHTGTDELATQIRDLLGDLFHLGDAADIDIHRCLKVAREYYHAEIRGE